MSSWEWWDAAQVGAFLGGKSAREVRERIACKPGFPPRWCPFDVGRPMWRSDEVREWSEQERQKQLGRVRSKATDHARADDRP